MTLQHKFVDFIPVELMEETLYVSVDNEIIAHKCCCGCGEKVFTPLTPIGWKMLFDGETVSINPSVGNWGLPCKSHYWIQNNGVVWSTKWSNQQINLCRKEEEEARVKFYENVNTSQKKSIRSRFLQWIKPW